MDATLLSLDKPRHLRRGTAVWLFVALVAYAALVVVAWTLAPRPLREVPSTAVAHALITFTVAGITAMLMFSHARATGRRGYLLLGMTFGYLSGVMLMFPFVFPGALIPEERILGAEQSAPTLFYVWHLAFVVGIGVSAVVIASDQRRHRRPGLHHGAWIALGCLAAGLALTLLMVTTGHDLLPALLDGTGTITPFAAFLDKAILGLAAVAAVVTLVAARNGSVIGLWLAAIALLVLGEAVVSLNTPGRFTAGWYYNRVFGLVAYSALLITLIWNLAKVDRATSRLALSDMLTDVESRASFADTLDREVAAAADNGTRVALLWVDIDGFKAVNDELGHTIGDEVLRVVAGRLRARAGPLDAIGRVGGDEFGILLVNDPSDDHIAAVADQLLATVRDPFVVEETTTLLTCSVGIALSPDDACGTSELLMMSGLAMHAAKTHGGNCHRRFEEGLGADALQAARLRHDLAIAIREAAFDLDYQPIVDTDTAEVVGAEALVRWVHGGQRRPAGSFIEFAERSGQVLAIGGIVLDVLERDLPRVLERVGEDFFLTVNLSVKELGDRTLIDRLLDGPLRSTSGRIVVEVTESLELHNDTGAERSLRDLRSAGFRLAIDDFGVGFSNFARLEHLEPSILKADRSLVSRAGEEREGGLAFLSATVSIAESLGCTLIAEGVELPAEADAVSLLRIRLSQGYLHHRPVPLEGLLELLERRGDPDAARSRTAIAGARDRSGMPSEG